MAFGMVSSVFLLVAAFQRISEPMSNKRKKAENNLINTVEFSKDNQCCKIT